MSIIMYIFSGLFFLAALGSISTAPIFALICVAIGALLVWGAKRRKHNGSSGSTHKAQSGGSSYMLSVTAGRLSGLVNESLKIAQNSNNVGTKLSRLSFAKEQLDELKRLVGENSELRLDGLNQVERDIERLEREFESAGYFQAAKGNAGGQVLEKEGKVDEAIEIYERLVESKVDTPFTYKRLAILYKKRKQKNDEIRILNAAICNIPSENSMRKWFSERLEKINRGGSVAS